MQLHVRGERPQDKHLVATRHEARLVNLSARQPGANHFGVIGGFFEGVAVYRPGECPCAVEEHVDGQPRT